MQDRDSSRENSTVFCESPPFPGEMLLEPTNACNLRCVFCGNAGSSRKKNFIDLGVASRLLREAYAGGTREAGFYLTGEPLLHPELATMIRVAAAIGYTYIYVTTNGILATGDRIRELAENGLDSLKFSLNAGDRESYARIHGRDEFDTVKANLLSAIEVRDHPPSPGRWLRRVMVSCAHVGEPTREILALRDELGSRVEDFSLTLASDCLAVPDSRNRAACTEPFHRLYVTAEGCLAACSLDHRNATAVSRLTGESLLDAWTNAAFREVRRRLLSGDVAGTACGACLRKDAVEDE